MDLSIFLFSFFAAFLIGFEGRLDSVRLNGMFLLCPFLVLLRFSCFHLFSIFPITWKSFSINDVVAVIKAVLLPTAFFLLGRVFLASRWVGFAFPWSIVFLEFLFVLSGCLGVRVADRLVYEKNEKRNRGKKLLLIGAGVVGTEFVLGLKQGISPMANVLGFVDDDPGKKNLEICGIKVLGNTTEIPLIAKDLGIDEMVITIADLAAGDIARIIDACRGAKAKLTYFHRLFEPLYDETALPPSPEEDPEAAVQEQLRIFKNVTGRDYDPSAEAMYPVDHPFEVNKPFSDPEGLSGDLIMASGTMIKLLRLPPGSSVLDLGCGCGWTSIILARCGFRVTAADVNEASLQTGRNNALKLALPVTFVKADSQDFSFDHPFDAIVIFDSLHHVFCQGKIPKKIVKNTHENHGYIFQCFCRMRACFIR